MTIAEKIKNMTVEDKALLITGAGSMVTHGIMGLDIPELHMADGPHGIRLGRDDDCASFPSLCCVAASWDRNAAYENGAALAEDCRHHGIDMILGPGMNIKRNVNCGRNFEYFSEDPLLAGELAAGMVNGIQDGGVSACVKHYAINSQEQDRIDMSVEVDERTMREIYLRGFEIMVKKSNPHSIMCSYNKVNSVWASEHKQLLTDILKGDYGFEGAVVSDWGAVHNACRAIMAGLDLQMPSDKNIVAEVKAGLADGELTMQALDAAVARVIGLAMHDHPASDGYDRTAVHEHARRVAARGAVLMKNEGKTLPVTSEKYRRIAIFGEYAVNPMINGQGSAEVYPHAANVDIPLDELKKRLPDCEIRFVETFKRNSYPDTMCWSSLLDDFRDALAWCDLAVVFCGSMESEDTEKFDRNSIRFSSMQNYVLEEVTKKRCRSVAVIQSGGAMRIPDYADKRLDAVLEMWLAGEGGGSAVADVLTGIFNPGGKLPETFPKEMRADLGYPGNGYCVEYREKSDVGYRYYDKHPDEIQYPFGHGLSYTEFEYSGLTAEVTSGGVNLGFDVKNVGDRDGDEVWQLYVADQFATVGKRIKELRAFDRVTLKAGECRHVSLTLGDDAFAHYCVPLHAWIVEDGKFDIAVGSSSRDIRLTAGVVITGKAPYTMTRRSEDMVG